jgi:hypothetical protein
VKRAFASLAGLIGIAALGRWLAKRTHPVASPVEPVEAVPPAEATAADPAEELRRKLADARVTEPDVDSAPKPPDETLDETLDERRARVHAKAREAIDSMAGDSPVDGGTAS